MNRLMIAVLAALLLAAVAFWTSSGLSGEDSAAPALRALALLAVAGVAGTVATAGPLRRGVGGLLGLIGVLGVLTSGAVGPAGTALAVLGGALLAATAVALVAREPALPRLSMRYEAPAARRSGPADPDRRLWDRLDAGQDPTADEPIDRYPDDEQAIDEHRTVRKDLGTGSDATTARSDPPPERGTARG